MDELIIAQIKDSCPCFCDKTDDELEVMISKLISLLSVSLCWNSDICGTFLYGEREETFTYVPDNCMVCQPCNRYKKYPLYYHADNSKLEVISVQINTYVGLETNEFVLPPNAYTIRKGVLIIDSSVLPVTCCTCSCEEYEIVVNYNAGYELIPDCMLPIFCDLLTNLSLSLSGCGSITDCCSMDRPQAYRILKSKKIGEISRTWETDKENLSYIYQQMYNVAELNKIAQMSCCNNDYNNERLWFVTSC